MDALDEIYTDLIMEHYAASPYKHELRGANYSEHGHNPNCGDDITLQLITDGKTITDMSYTGVGCAISQSATSIMIETLIGKTLLQAKAIIESYLKMIRREKLTKKELSTLQNLVAFENISNMPARVKCATLSAYTLNNLLEQINSNMSK